MSLALLYARKLMSCTLRLKVFQTVKIFLVFSQLIIHAICLCLFVLAAAASLTILVFGEDKIPSYDLLIKFNEKAVELTRVNKFQESLAVLEKTEKYLEVKNVAMQH
jgi:hypothetical protein